MIERLHIEAKNHSDIFRVQQGHDVFQFLPKDINKGMAIDHLIEEYPDHYPLYFGDDLTDNFAFKRIKAHGGLAIQIGERLKEQEAEYMLPDVDEVYKFIENLIKI